MDGQKVFPFRADLSNRTGGAKVSQRMGWLTPYEVEALVADALGAGAGARLVLSVPSRTSDSGVEWIRNRFDGLCQRGIAVRVRRDADWSFEVTPRAAGLRLR